MLLMAKNAKANVECYCAKYDDKGPQLGAVVAPTFISLPGLQLAFQIIA
jgi:hypothetical protein